MSSDGINDVCLLLLLPSDTQEYDGLGRLPKFNWTGEIADIAQASGVQSRDDLDSLLRGPVMPRSRGKVN